jgi:streptogramin lyase
MRRQTSRRASRSRSGSGPTSIAARDGIVWVANTDDSTVTRVDADTSEVVGGPIALTNPPVAVAAGDGGAWVVDARGAVIWIDSESNEPEEQISLGGSPLSLVFGDGALWVADAFNRMVTRIEL